MRACIYFHGDFDGAVSGAIMYKFLTSLIPSDVIELHSIDYNRADEWSQMRFDGDLVAVVDFKFTEGLLSAPFFIYADHHNTGITNEQLLRAKSAPNGFCVFDASAPSCAGMISPLADLHPEVIRCADMVDSASYDSPEQALKMDKPEVLKIAAAIASGGDALRRKVLLMLATQPIDTVVKDSEIVYLHAKYASRQLKALNHLSLNAEVIGNIGIASFLGCFFSSRYAIFVLHPDIDYSVFVRAYQDNIYLSVGRNPWKELRKRYNIGEIMTMYGGGGREDVGAVILHDPDRATAIARDIANKFASGAFESYVVEN
ncbi:hypothetical protein DRO59_03280 [Candidatus Bathyarchaeota archaeon]|nr:MAG: hypothetical protein DRO59_03280 [Candidatus Bathyarchaeota archaeon]